IETEYIKLDEYIQSTKKALENINKYIDEIENKHNVTKDKYLNLKSIYKELKNRDEDFISRR
ncbi:MAG: hypothetical protein ACLTY6_02670, partial [Clostridium perfringens]